jgi:hypothetical protein
MLKRIYKTLIVVIAVVGAYAFGAIPSGAPGTGTYPDPAKGIIVIESPTVPEEGKPAISVAKSVPLDQGITGAGRFGNPLR